MGDYLLSGGNSCSTIARVVKHGHFDSEVSSEHGSMLVEVLVATTVLLIVFTGILQQVSNLAMIRVRIESRDRAVAYIHSLHQIMSANGCGFDVDTVDEIVTSNIPQGSNSFLGSDQQSLRGPWDRVQGCAFGALERVRNEEESLRSYAYVDDNDVVHLTSESNGTPSDNPLTKSIASAFCKIYGDDNVQYTTRACEMGDQSFEHPMLINDQGVIAKFHVSIHYWFEIVGGSQGVVTAGINRKSSCNSIMITDMMPDTLARRIEVTFPNGKGGIESIVVTKRENVPVDSFQFASGTRVGVAALAGDMVSMYPSPGSDDPWKVTRTRESSTSCIWFPYITRHEVGTRQPTFSVDSSGPQEAPLNDIKVLSTGAL